MLKRFCDKCGKEIKDGSYKSIRITFERGADTKKDICIDCCNEMGLLIDNTSNIKPIQTLGDKIYDVIREIISAEMQNQ